MEEGLIMADDLFTIPDFTLEEYLWATLLPSPIAYVTDRTGETAAYVNFNIAAGIAYSYAVGGDTWFSYRTATALSRAPAALSVAARASVPLGVAYVATQATSDVLTMQAERAASLQTGGASTPPSKPWWMPFPVYAALYD